MLARTPATLVYLSAEELGVTPRERVGLIEVRDDLASGRVRHGNIIDDVASIVSWGCSPTAPAFNMEEYDSLTDCGTAHCIGGFMRAREVWGSIEEIRGRKTLFSSPFHSLFYPNIRGDRWYKLTVEQAVRAIDHFLAGAGPDCWAMALADIPPA